MSDEMEQLDLEACELISRIRAASEAMEWDTKKAALSKENKEAEFKKIKVDMDKARTLLQARNISMEVFHVCCKGNDKQPRLCRLTRWS
jgi:hypothetical protein